MPAPRHCPLLPVALLALAAGCDDPVRPKSATTAAAPAPKPAPAPAPEAVQTRDILGKTTQDIKNFDEETAKGGRAAPGQVTEKGYIAVVGNSYVVAMDKIGEMQVTQAIELYRAENDGNYPKDYKEFMDGVIKHYGITLPQIPYYQEYSYDEKNHKLVVLEYPARKAARAKERGDK